VVAIQQMTDMDMPLPGFGSFASFITVWVLMIGAMMLPGAAPAVSRDAGVNDSVRAVLMIAQKMLPPKASIDMPLALAIISLGILIVVAPSSVPRFTPPM
jgi:hypothetical protein